MDAATLNKLIAALEANTAAQSGGSGGDGASGSGAAQRRSAGLEGMDAAEARLEAAKLEEELKSLKSSYDGLYRSISQGNDIREKEIELAIAKATADGKSAAEIKKLTDRYKALEAQTSAASQLTQTAQKATGLTLDSTSEKFVKLGQDMANVRSSGGSLVKTFGGVAKSLGARALMKPFELLVSQTIALAVAQDEVISQFRKATGATKEYNYEITQLERRNFAAGVSIQESGKAFGDLFTSFSAFTELNQSERAAIGDTVAVLGELGVSAQVSGKILDQMYRGLGMSAKDANDVLLDLAGSAQALGVPMSKMSADFSSAFGELSKYGDEAIDVFKELSVISKSTGMEVNRLIQITQQFETFDGAATSVGKLNAILGGPYLNSIDMLNASEEERVRILRDQVAVSGLQFEQLGRYEKKTIASALGVSVDEAQRLLGLSEEQYKLDALSQQQAADLAKEAMSIKDELKSAIMGLAVDLRPLIDGVIVPLIRGFGQIAIKIGQGINAVGQFSKAALLAAGIASLIAAPFTGGASLLAFAKLAAIGGATFGVMKMGMHRGGGLVGAKDTGPITPGFAAGGTITTQQAAVHPGEMIVTGGQGSDVLNKEQIADMISKAVVAATTAVQAPPQQIAVYVGQEKIDELVVKGINSPAGQAAFAPFGNG
mgnify:CR=1 FL=1